MSLYEYFQNTTGTGILATANEEGIVNTAIYARPHFAEGQSNQVAFIMRDRLSHVYVNSNPHACYMFIEDGEQYKGKRLILRKNKEETDREKIMAIRRRDVPEVCRENEDKEAMFLVTFDVLETRPLLGATEKSHT